MKTPEEIKKGLECCTKDGDCTRCPYNHIYGRMCKVYRNNDALAYIQRLEAQVPKWISVEERLLEAYHTYLVTIKEKYTWETEWRYHVDVADMVDSGGYIEDRWNTFNDWNEGQEIRVTHWMPLPEPPKEEGV